MLRLKLVGKKGSAAGKAIAIGAGIPKFTGSYDIDGIVNYGLAGNKFKSFLNRYKKLESIPILNKNIGMSKYRAVKLIEKNGILTPDSRLELPKKYNKKDWIEKRIHSIGGKGIRFAESSLSGPNTYFQRFIKNRKYELRVHVFSWMPDLNIQKRLGDKDTLAWNFSAGGYFQTVHNTKQKIFVNAQDIARKVLDVMGMAFGAVDFVITDDYEIYFLEVNSAPGFTELSKPIYLEAFSKLKTLQLKKFTSLCNNEITV